MPPPPKPPPPIKLVLTTNSTRNTTIADASDSIYYEIRTEPWIPLHTKVKKLDPETRKYEVRAEIQRSGGIPEVRILGRSKEWAQASEFLRIDKAKDAGPLAKGAHVIGRFLGDDGKVYRWQDVKGHLELVRVDSEHEGPVVVQHHHKRHFWVFRMSKHAWLEVKQDAKNTLDSIILSYLMIERKRRHVEKDVGEL